MLRVYQTGSSGSFAGLRLALALTGATALAGCMSSPAEQLASIKTAPAMQTSHSPRQDNTIVEQARQDAQLANRQAELYPRGEEPVQQPQDAGQRTFAATQNSLFSSPAAAARSAGTQLNAASASIYSGGVADQLPRSTGGIPLPDAKTVGEVQDLALAGMPVPSEMQQVASAETTVATTDVQPTPTEAGGAAMETGSPEHLMPRSTRQPPESGNRPRRKYKSLADLFRRRSDDDDSGSGQGRFGKNVVANAASIPNMGIAGVDPDSLSGSSMNSLLPVPQDFQSGDDDDGGGIKLASLSGMTRIAPNGLWTQTDQVEVRCLRPQLVSMLKTVEMHYGKAVVVTSGYRDPAHNRLAGGARHSLHTLCAAADIQVEGVSKWELADFLRSIPGRGGVGTYCHTESVHIDVGMERDWNWRCRRGKRRLF